MLPDHQHAAREGDGGPSCSNCTDLLCLLRLNEIVLEGVEPDVGAKAMLDELARLDSVLRAVVAVPTADAGHVDFIAHFGLPELPPHSPVRKVAPPMMAQAMATRQLVQLSASEGGSSHASVSVPLLGGEQLLGGLCVGLKDTVPIDRWVEQLIWAAADLISLILLDDRKTDREPALSSGALGLTRRQADVIYELVDRGASNAQIAGALGLSARTVKIHLQAAYRHLGVRRRGDAIRLILTRHATWLQVERERRRHARPVL